MRSAWTRVCSSALGVASSVILMAFNARRMLGFIRGQFACRACEDNLGTVFLLGNAYVLSDLASVVLYDFLFKALPHFFLSFFPAWAFWSWHGGLDLGLRQLCPVFLLVVGFVALSDVCNLVGTPCYGEAGACGSVRDACLFGVFLLHRFSPLAFFALVWRRGFAKLPRSVWLLLGLHAACTAGVAIERIVSHPNANQTEPCLFAVCGVTLTVACGLASLAEVEPPQPPKYDIMSAQKGSLT